MTGVWHGQNQVELLINGEDYFPRVFEAIRAARHEVLVETFIIFEDPVGQALQQALIEAAERGVRIEVTADGYGTADLGKAYIEALTRVGVRVHLFDPRPKMFGMRTNLFRRLHRKIVVVDGEVAYVGGINFCLDHLQEFGPMAKQDYAVEVRGPVVADIHRAAVELLAQCGVDTPGAGLRPSPGSQGRSAMLLAIRDNDAHQDDIEDQYMAAIRNARERLLVANAYFFPGYRLLRELRNAAQRGVQVSLILQGQPDMRWVWVLGRLLYDYLLRDGVQIYEYCEKPLHGKVALADREWSTVGSSNLDPLSLSLNLEANLFIRDPTFNQRLFAHLSELAETRCKPVTRQVLRRGYWWRAPLMFLGFHAARHFPAVLGWFPAHRPKLTTAAAESPDTIACGSGKS
ncbi:cardiolipin synthase ClsB [Pseudomonas flexibilis]|uniref:Cardiolipin synthase B n=1 Tax=Pseudomonas flexibilis TaxID=706570 RepID=A0A0B3BNK4_9PSED|nr:cardiolipin synthase ClsB [Pseudomonas flexibilis]KHO64200.1 cardiolipin synthase 2 [Pseudomonas flexibilis]SCY14840.1 putative cardiolipin synthase [Pseudomonas flexibilis]